MSETRTKTKASKSKGKSTLARTSADLPPALDALIEAKQFRLALRVGPTYFQKMREKGELPPPDSMVGTRPRWRTSTFNAFALTWRGDLG